MASALGSARPVENHLQKDYTLTGTLNGNLVVTVEQLSGAREILYAEGNPLGIDAASAAAQMLVTAVISADRKSVTFYGFEDDGTATTADNAFTAYVKCLTEAPTV